MDNILDVKKKGVRLSLAAIICTIGILGSYFLKYFYNAKNFAVVCILISSILYVVVLIKINCNMEDLKYKTILIFSGITKFIFVLGCIVESNMLWKEIIVINPIVYLFVMYFFLVVLDILGLVLFYKNKDLRKLKFYIIVCLWIVYYLAIVNIYSFWSLIILIPALTAFSQFEDVKLMFASDGIVSLLAIVGACRQIEYFETGKKQGMLLNVLGNIKYFYESPFNEKNGYNRCLYIIVLALLFVYFFAIIKITQTIKNRNEGKIEVTAKEQKRIEELMAKIIKIGMRVETSTNETNRLVGELDVVIKNDEEVLEKIVDDTRINLQNIKEQTDMNHNVSSLIGDVVDEVSKVKTITDKSTKELTKNKDYVTNLKNRSVLINENNIEIMKLMDEFVENANQVKKILKEIEYISDETNLLSINASIKSLRAGEVGKGFVVVARHISVLAKETADLTNSINNIVNNLEHSAHITQNLITQVVDSIKQENSTIDKTIKEFDSIENNIKNLCNNVDEIANSMDNLIKYNSSIEEHILQMFDASERFIFNTTEAKSLNDENRNKSDRTRKLMNSMLDIVQRMEKMLQ